MCARGFTVSFSSSKVITTFPLSASVFQVPDSLGSLTQPVTPVDDRRYLSRLHELVHDGQVLVVLSRQKHDQVLVSVAAGRIEADHRDIKI